MLLPHYRLKLLRVMPSVEMLDGMPVSEEERLDAQLVSMSQALAPRPPFLRVAFRPSVLANLRPLLAEVVSKHNAEFLTASNKLAPEPGQKDKDPLVEACAGGALRFNFQLPSGAWAESSDVSFDDIEITGDGQDSLNLSHLKKEDGSPLVFDVGLQDSEDEAEDGLFRLCYWLLHGMAVSVFYRRALPRAPVDDELAQSNVLGKRRSTVSQSKSERLSIPLMMTAEALQEALKPVVIGGGVTLLDFLLRRTETGVTEEMRAAVHEGNSSAVAEAKELSLPELPAPSHFEVDALVVPQERRLEPEVQVPQARTVLGKVSRPAASLRLSITLYADAVVSAPSTADELRRKAMPKR